MSRICPSCGGIVGRDCFNVIECAQITENLAREHDQDHYKKGYDDGYYEGYQAAINEILRKDAEENPFPQTKQ